MPVSVSRTAFAFFNYRLHEEGSSPFVFAQRGYGCITSFPEFSLFSVLFKHFLCSFPINHRGNTSRVCSITWQRKKRILSTVSETLHQTYLDFSMGICKLWMIHLEQIFLKAWYKTCNNTKVWGPSVRQGTCGLGGTPSQHEEERQHQNSTICI